MVEILRGWLLGLVAAALILTVLRALVPKGSIRPVARVTAGLVLLLVLLRPLAGLGGGSLRVRYDELEREITARIEDYQTLHENELESIIADSTAAYISEQAAHLGLTCGRRCAARCGTGHRSPHPRRWTFRMTRGWPPPSRMIWASRRKSRAGREVKRHEAAACGHLEEV